MELDPAFAKKLPEKGLVEARKFIRVGGKINVGPPLTAGEHKDHYDIAQEDGIVEEFNEMKDSSKVDAGYMMIFEFPPLVKLSGDSTTLMLPQSNESRAQTVKVVHNLFPGHVIETE